ncbi:hypothetical protein G9464_00745 [Halostella sp. JP-L12]|uniref:hypothetical protein n=1 Tax=Halostella TaxID=1843185 RepID=UPI0013CE88DF|nr:MULTISPECIES: hypothetical protein [Halostella]NHN46126.1 hypothetical protein [Halostella sp. JP-L12]
MAARDPSASLSARPRVDSNWWYVVAIVPLFGLFVTAFVGWMIAWALLGAGEFGPAAMPMPGGGMPFAFAPMLLGMLLFGTAGTLLTAAYPVALYLDAGAVADAGVGWDPDPVLYALVGVVGALSTAFAFAVPLSAYYLYRRHQHVGVP